MKCCDPKCRHGLDRAFGVCDNHVIMYIRKINESWDTLRTILNRQYRVTSTMQMQDNKTIIVRKTSQPTGEQIEIYKALGISSLPGKIIKNYV